MDYFIRQDGPNRYTVAKYEEDRKYPLETYKLSGNECSCPSPKYPCKHAALIAKWLQVPNKELYYYDDKADMFVRHIFNPMSDSTSTQT